MYLFYHESHFKAIVLFLGLHLPKIWLWHITRRKTEALHLGFCEFRNAFDL